MGGSKRVDEVNRIENGVNGIRADLVDRIKGEIADSTYKVKSDEIAEKMTQVIKEDESSKLLNKLKASSNRLK